MIIKRCKFKKCKRKYYGRGYCKMHWLRWRKWGDASIVKHHFKTPELIKAKLKRCSICQKIKPYSEFSKNNHTKDKCQDYCKECIAKGYLKIKKKFNGLYSVWQNMNNRCSNPKCKTYKYYGGRGIKVCKKWQNSFKVFYEWTKDKHKRGLQIDRRNNDKGYYPRNCRFVTRIENMKNSSLRGFTKH